MSRKQSYQANNDSTDNEVVEDEKGNTDNEVVSTESEGNRYEDERSYPKERRYTALSVDQSRKPETPFKSMVRASGHGEVWTHSHDDLKFGQFGWRCTNKENCFANEVLIGNWNQERYDIGKQKNAKRLPSQYEHYFESTYGSSFNFKPTEVPPELKHLKSRHPHAHPGHQPELDTPGQKAIYNSWETTSRAAYLNPDLRKDLLPAQQPGQVPPAETVQ